jgi:hypothetical protein
VKRLLFPALAVAGFLFALVAAAFFLVPRLFNTATVRDFALSRLERATGVRMSYADADITLFPRIHLVLRQVSLTVPGATEGSIPTLSADADLLPLLRGKFRLGNVLLESPDFRAHLPAKEKPEKAWSLEELEKEISGLLVRIREKAPGMAVTVRNGRVELSDPDGPILSIRDLEARITLPPGRATAQIRCTSPYWDGLSIETSLQTEGLRSETRVETAGLRIRELAERLSPGVTPWLGETVLSARGRIDSAGLRTATADIAGSIPTLTIRRGSRSHVLRVRTVKAKLELKDDIVRVDLNDLSLDEPEMRLSGELTVDRSDPRIAILLTGTGLMIPPVRKALLAVAGDVPAVRDVLDVVRGGNIPRFSIRAEAWSPEELGDAGALAFRATLTDGSIRIPGPDLALEKVGGEVTLARGILEGSGIAARLGKARATGGSLRMGIAGSDPPFHAEFRADADLEELPPLLRRLVPDGDFRGELDRIREIRGAASGRVVLGERLSSVEVRFTASDVRFAADYDRIPFPVAVEGGQIAYDGASFAVTDLRGAAGKSSFSGVTGAVSLSDSPALSVRSGKGRLALGELFPWLYRFDPVREIVPDIRMLGGEVEVESLSLDGALQGEGKWIFEASGSVADVVLDTPRLPGPLSVPAGRFRIRPESASFSGVTMSLLDTTVRGSIGLDGFRKGTDRIAAAFDGKIGPEAAKWVYGRLEVPGPFAVRAPYTVTGSEIVWERGGSVLATATLGLEEGVALSFTVQAAPGMTAVDPLEVRGPGSDARIAYRSDRDAARLAFSGTLSRDTVERILPVHTLPGHLVRGEVEAVIDRAKPARSTVLGTLEASGVTVPWKPLSPLAIRDATLEADGRTVRLLSSRMVWDNVPFRASGTARFGGEELIVDLDISAGDIDVGSLLPTLKLAGPAEEAPGGVEHPVATSGEEPGIANLPVRGTLRLAAESAAFRRFTWRPVRAVAVLGDNTVRLSISEATLCGISTVGTASLGAGAPSITLVTSSKGEEIQETILCLTEKRESISGRYKLSSSLSGEGTGDALLRSLKGPVAVDLADGRIRQMTLLSRIFSFLNLAETLRGRFPDLQKEGFSYRTLSVRGEAKGGKFLLAEVVLDAPSMQIVATGEVDLLSRETDLKVLVAPLRNVDEIVKNIPVLGYIVGGTLVSFPVTVKGDLQDPRVTLMDPGAVGSGLLGIAERTLKLPAKVISPFLPAEKEPGKP